jgi:hypothetical protein
VRGPRPLLALALHISACSSAVQIDLSPPWPADQIAVVVLTDSAGGAIGDAQAFGPDARIEFEAPRGLAAIHVDTFPGDTLAGGETPLVACGVTLTSTVNTATLAAATRWVTTSLDLADRKLSFAPDPMPPTFSLFPKCIVPDTICPQFRVSHVSAPPRIEPNYLTVVDDSLAFFATNSSTPSSQRALVRIDGTSAAFEKTLPVLDPNWQGLATVGTSTIFGITGDRKIFTMNRDGLLRFGPFGGNYVRIDAARDGSIVLATDFNESGYEITIGSSVTVPRPDIPGRARNFAAIRRDRIFISDNTNIWSFDGKVWSNETTVTTVENISAFGGDEDVMAYGTDMEVVHVRNEKTGEWPAIPTPFGSGARLRGLKGLGQGRFIVAGETGKLGLWTGSKWCRLDTGTRIALGDLDVSQSKKTAYVVAYNTFEADGTTVILRVDVP